MESSATGASSGGVGPDSGDAQGDSPLAALSTMAERVRTKAGEGKAAASDRLKGGLGESAGATVPAPPFEERPELYVGAAFAGGIVLAGLIRLLGR